MIKSNIGAGEAFILRGEVKKPVAVVDEIMPHLDYILETLARGKRESVTSERYQMYAAWYDEIDDVRLDIAGVLNCFYRNPEYRDD